MKTVHRLARCTGSLAPRPLLEFPDNIDPIVGQFMQKAPGDRLRRPCSCRNRGDGVRDSYVLGILATDFENRVHNRVHLHGATGVGSYFVDNEVGTEEISDYVSA